VNRKCILVVDDSPSLREVVGITLRGAGYDVLEAGDGRQALQCLDGRRIHLVVCDVNMPVMDGFSFVREARKLPRYAFVPIIMLTTEWREESKLEGQQAGARAWMVKPFRPEQMLQAVARLVLP